MGVQVTLSQRVQIRPNFGAVYGAETGFRLWDSKMSVFQPVALTGVVASNPTVVQLNLTWVSPGTPTTLTYGWSDYPTMPIEDSVYRRPVPPFNATLST